MAPRGNRSSRCPKMKSNAARTESTAWSAMIAGLHRAANSRARFDTTLLGGPLFPWAPTFFAVGSGRLGFGGGFSGASQFSEGSGDLRNGWFHFCLWLIMRAVCHHPRVIRTIVGVREELFALAVVCGQDFGACDTNKTLQLRLCFLGFFHRCSCLKIRHRELGHFLLSSLGDMVGIIERFLGQDCSARCRDFRGCLSRLARSHHALGCYR